jgi:hypothetical protein
MKRGFVYRHGRKIEVVHSGNVVLPKIKYRASGAEFIQMPALWVDKLIGEKNATLYGLALLILRLSFKHYGHSVRLSNIATECLGIDRGTKRRGLRRLAKLGLISVTSKPGSAPVVTIL